LRDRVGTAAVHARQRALEVRIVVELPVHLHIASKRIIMTTTRDRSGTVLRDVIPLQAETRA
jgi:hypothetical protein